MRFSSSEEYGLRCLLRLGREGPDGSLTIPEISRAEGISTPYVAKIMRHLRRGGYVQSTRGKAGGYCLARPVDKILVGDLLTLLGGRLFEPDFCERHTGTENQCANSGDCSIRPVWQSVQLVVDHVLNRITLGDLLRNEQTMSSWVNGLVNLPSPGARDPHSSGTTSLGPLKSALN
ncbi:MAG: Rrf2 family transcriptional regulator [Acidobacteriota bacterium]|nr:Rrf2 family transcriptional regulator [Acidobacteriota bacterium]